MNLVGRDDEIQLLENLLSSAKTEFLAIYGRRRIGKTYLIREFFRGKKEVIFLMLPEQKEAS